MAKAQKSVAGTVNDPTVQFAELDLDGKTFRLAYSFNAIAEAERFAGCNLLSGLENLGDLTALQLRGLLYAGLAFERNEDDRRYTIEEAGNLVRLDTIGPITQALAKAYRLSMPAPNADPPAAGAPAES